jgi:hypothetical protein
MWGGSGLLLGSFKTLGIKKKLPVKKESNHFYFLYPAILQPFDGWRRISILPIVRNLLEQKRRRSREVQTFTT